MDRLAAVLLLQAVGRAALCAAAAQAMGHLRGLTTVEERQRSAIKHACAHLHGGMAMILCVCTRVCVRCVGGCGCVSVSLCMMKCLRQLGCSHLLGQKFDEACHHSSWSCNGACLFLLGLASL